ncbi:MAG TPA: hypothetical protein PKY05_13440 [Fibrobacteria bacterium]|nr:hypothetical protein [Fibrobacteria bacterium]
MGIRLREQVDASDHAESGLVGPTRQAAVDFRNDFGSALMESDPGEQNSGVANGFRVRGGIEIRRCFGQGAQEIGILRAGQNLIEVQCARSKGVGCSLKASFQLGLIPRLQSRGGVGLVNQGVVDLRCGIQGPAIDQPTHSVGVPLVKGKFLFLVLGLLEPDPDEGSHGRTDCT